MAKILGVEFAPLIMPMRRRLQTFAVMQWVVSFLFLGFSCLLFMIWLALFTRAWPLVVLYIIWYLIDIRTPHRGGRRVDSWRRWKIWEHFKDFFPLKLVKTAELNPEKNYLFACHPHGVLCVSHFCSFATEATGFSKLFPGITPHLLVLDGHFQFPLYREYFMGTGSCGCNKASLEYILAAKGLGNAACLAIGGALEALEAHPGQFTLNLANKKGFIKSALRTGAYLVPVFSFGENEVYQQVSNPTGSKVRQFQDLLTKYLGFSPPLFHGRGIFNYSMGLLPYRKPVTTVVGEPIEVEKRSAPTNQDIDDLHSRYIAGLQKLFETHKHEYGVPEVKHLKFI